MNYIVRVESIGLYCAVPIFKGYFCGSGVAMNDESCFRGVGREHNIGFTRPLQCDSFVSCPVVLSIQVYFFLDDVIKEDDCSHLQ